MSKQYKAHRDAFVARLLPILKRIEDERPFGIAASDSTKEFECDAEGIFYNIRWVRLKAIDPKDDALELRIYANNANPKLIRYQNVVHERCWVYPSSFKQCWDKRFFAVSKDYYLMDYARSIRPKLACFYCDCRHLAPNSRVHDKTKKHITNRARVESELAGAAKIPKECMLQILEYLY